MQALTHQISAVVAKYGKAPSTRDARHDCTTIGLPFATGMSTDGGKPTLLASYSSDVTALDEWIWDGAVPTVAATNPLQASTNFNALTTRSAATSVCYFLGAYGEQLSSPVNPMPANSQAVQLVFVTNGKAYWAGTLPDPVPAVYERPPSA